MSRGKVVDFHAHAFPPEVVANRDRFAALDAGFALLYASPKSRVVTADDLLAEMTAAQVDHSVVLGFGWSDAGICREHTAYLCDAARAHPTRLTAFAATQPSDSCTASAIAQAAALGARGVGELMPHLQGFDLDDEAVTSPLGEAASALGLIVLTHSSEPVGHIYPGKGDVSPRSLLAFVRQWPELHVVGSHWGGGLPFYELMPEVAEATRNLYYDTAASPLLFDHRVYQSVVDITGPERVLFGSDYPLLGRARCLRRLRAAGLTPQVLEKVAGERRPVARALSIDGVTALPDSVRSFIAVDLPEDVRRQLASIQDRLRAHFLRAGIERGLRWIGPDGIHLTLKFLGETPVGLVPDLGRYLEESLNGLSAPMLSLAGLGVFPNQRAPRVLWVGLAGDLPSLLALQRRVEDVISPLGFPAESRPFSPHLTLARVAETVSRDERERIGAAVQASRGIAGINFSAQSVSLIRSDLLPGGAVYTPLHTVSLQARGLFS